MTKKPLTDAQRRARKKYEGQGKHVIVACKVTAEAAQEFKEYAAGLGSSPNRILCQHIAQCIGHDPGRIPAENQRPKGRARTAEEMNSEAEQPTE